MPNIYEFSPNDDATSQHARRLREVRKLARGLHRTLRPYARIYLKRYPNDADAVLAWVSGHSVAGQTVAAWRVSDRGALIAIDPDSEKDLQRASFAGQQRPAEERPGL